MKAVAEKKSWVGTERSLSNMSDPLNNEISDEALLKRFINQNNQLAFNQIYNRYFVPLSKYVAWLANDIEVGKDIAQSVFIKLYSEPHICDVNKIFKTWLFVVAKNTMTNEWRNLSNRNRLLQEQIELPETEESLSPDPRMNKINKALEQLSDDHKSVFILKYSSNLTIKEISEVIDCSEGTVKSRLFYAIQHLKDIIGIQK